jgi:hypothetical protein
MGDEGVAAMLQEAASGAAAEFAREYVPVH